MGTTRVIVVGGGIAGLEAAARIARHRDVDLTLIDKSLSHVWKPMLHRFAAGTARSDLEKVSLLDHAKRNRYHFRPGTLVSVDRAARSVVVDASAYDGQTAASCPFDVLILAIGSRANDFGTPGVCDHCSFIDDLEEADALHGHLRQPMFRAMGVGTDVTIAIVGGGATGVELAAELRRGMDVVAGYGPPSLGSRLRVTLLESGPRLLPPFPEHVSHDVATTLKQLGVDVRTGARVVAADATGFDLQDGSRIEAVVKIWAAGVKAPDVLADIDGLERDHVGKLVVTPSLQTTNDDGIFALGDCASLVQASGKPVPATAQAARAQGIHIGNHFGEWLHGHRIQAFAYRDRGSIVSLADYGGWASLGTLVVGGERRRGWSARVGHALLYRQHQIDTLGLPRGLAAWLLDVVDTKVKPGVRLD